MRLLTFLFLVVSFQAIGQAQDSAVLIEQKRSIIGTVRDKINVVRSGVTSPLDSTKQAITGVADSLQSTPQDSLRKATHAGIKPQDSLRQLSQTIHTNAITPVQKVNATIDSVEQKMNAPLNKVNEKVSAVQQTVNEKTGLGEGGINSKIDNIEGKIDNGFSKATDGNVKRPGENVNFDADQLGVKTPDIETLNGKNIPEIGNENIPDAGDLKLPSADLSVDALKEKAVLEIPEADKILDVGSKVEHFDSKLAEGEGYENEVRQVAKGDLSDTEKISGLAEENVQGIEQVQLAGEELQKATAQQERYAAMMKKFNDPKALAREMELKALNVVTEQLTQDNPIIRKAVDEVTKMKELHPSAQGFKDATKKRVNEMKGKPFHEHLVPGITVQVFPLGNVFTFDWGLQLGYKFSKRLRAGVAGTCRSSFSEDYKRWATWDRVYGFRSFLNFELYKTFYAHGEHAAQFGKIDTAIPEQIAQRVQSGYFGIGKRYDISPRFQGSALILYRAQFEGEIPLMNRISMRIEFNINTKKVAASNWKHELKEKKKKAKR